MADVATNITQSVTFYNTTGVIEKDHNIYFCPHLTGQGSLPTLWLTAFSSAVTTLTTETMGQWLPEDRVLTVKGDIDNFRDIYSRLVANYCIVTRNVTSGGLLPVTTTTYYAYFISDAKQVGNGAVRLTLEPDHFTNVFYLQNNVTGNDRTTIFTDFIRNSYVKRQHYDRVKKDYNYNVTQRYNITNSVDEEGVISGTNIFRMTLPSGYNRLMSGQLEFVWYGSGGSQPVEVPIVSQSLTFTQVGSKVRVSGSIKVLSDYASQSLSFQFALSLNNFSEVNLDIFANMEETFRYKRQLRDFKQPLNYGQIFTEEELEDLKTLTWAGLGTALQIKAIKASCAFLHIVCNKIEVVAGYINNLTHVVNHSPVAPIPKMYPVGVNTLQTLIMPVAVVPDFLSRFKTNIEYALTHYTIIWTDALHAQHTLSNGEFLLREFLENIFLKEYVISAYLTRESYLLDEITFSGVGMTINIYNTQTDAHSQDEQTKNYLAVYPITTDRTIFTKFIDRSAGYVFTLLENTDYIETRLYDTSGTQLNITFGYAFIERYDKSTFNLDLSTVTPDIKTNFYDPVLTFNPYSFYTISYLGQIEVPLNKLNYYQNPNIKFDLTVIVTDVCKYNLLPTYVINGLEQKMYQESLYVTLANHLTILDSKLADYIVANQTQMKNQYAVNEMNLGKGLITTTVKGVSKVATGAIMGGSYGALAGGISATADTINEVVTWGYERAEIGMNQKAKLADMGNLPNTLKQAGTDVNVDIITNEFGLYLNHYDIDELSHVNICKYLERYGYLVNLYDTLNAFNRRSWNYVELISLEFAQRLTVEQEDSIRQIFYNGVTLLHRPEDLHPSIYVHNYETSLS